jgi:hypothetical protein
MNMRFLQHTDNKSRFINEYVGYYWPTDEEAWRICNPQTRDSLEWTRPMELQKNVQNNLENALASK